MDFERFVDRRFHKPIKFVAVGVWNTIFGYGVFVVIQLIAQHVGLHYMFSLVFSTIISIANAYLCYKIFVFKSDGWCWKEASRFLGVCGLNFLGNSFLLPLFVNVVRMTPIPAQGLAVVIMATVSYLSHNYFTFRPQSSGDGADLAGVVPNARSSEL